MIRIIFVSQRKKKLPKTEEANGKSKYCMPNSQNKSTHPQQDEISNSRIMYCVGG